MAGQSDPWFAYSIERQERLLRTRSVEAYGTTDLCGLPMLRAKPCSASSHGAGWFTWCPCCQWQVLSRTSSDLFALFGYGDLLQGLTHEARAGAVSKLATGGRDYLGRATWAEVSLGGKKKVISTGPLLGCVHCGERGSVELRLDKWRRPYPRCNACHTQVFPRISHSQCLTTGLALAVRDGALAWTRCWERGQALWSSWRALGAGSVVTQVGDRQGEFSSREVANVQV